MPPLHLPLGWSNPVPERPDVVPFDADCFSCAQEISAKLSNEGWPFSITHAFRMYLCPLCGDKRCAKAHNHLHACTVGVPSHPVTIEPTVPEHHDPRSNNGWQREQ